ncbi:MAG: L-seryl-tRNA(Sec) selenium transferase [Sandaracinaceae bacterium]
MTDDPRRALPATDKLARPELVARYGKARVLLEARELLAEARRRERHVPSASDLTAELERRLGEHVGRFLNATGVVLHTNLGRAPWSARAQRAASEAMGYACVELDRASGQRGARAPGLERRLCALTGAEAALVVNNGAAAVLLALSALARGTCVAVSRGQLVEIGGGFRIPEILAISGAELVEVGTTNRTHLRDYRAALDRARAVLWVHASNFRQVGFVTQPTIEELASLGVPVICDLGSGALFDVDDEPRVADAIAAGADVVCISGDKLLGGPQAGILLGKRALLDGIRRDPFMRAMRVDKVTLAALEGTLDDHLTGEPTPVRAMIEMDCEALRAVAEDWAARLPGSVDAEVIDVDGAIGGGSVPGTEWPSVALAIRAPDPQRIFHALLREDPPVLARIHKERLLLDPRTVAPLGQADELIAALLRAIDSLG